MKKTLNLILGMFLLCSMVVPLIGLLSTTSYQLDFDEYSMDVKQDSNSDYESLVLTQTADNLVIAANDLLLSRDIEADNIRVVLKKTDDNSIYISSIYIYINKDYEDKAEEIKRIIGSNMSKEPVIIISED